MPSNGSTLEVHFTWHLQLCFFLSIDLKELSVPARIFPARATYDNS